MREEEKNVRRRKEGARQRAHYELTTFRYRPRHTETRREAAVPPPPAEQSALLPSGSSEPLPRHQSRMGSRSGSADAPQHPAVYSCPMRCPAPSAYPVMIAS